MNVKRYSCVAVCVLYNVFSRLWADNYSDIKVDELTDTQVRQLVQRSEAAGNSDVQLEQMAAAQGMKQEEVIKLRARVDKLKKADGNGAKAKNPVANDNLTDRTDRNYDDSDTTKTIEIIRLL